jgi:hypothetical protein
MSGCLVTQLRATPDIGVGLRTRVAGGHGQARLEALTLEDVRTGQRDQVPAAAVLVMIGAGPRTQWHRDLVKLNDRGFVLTGRDVPPGAWPLPRPPLPFKTSLPGDQELAAQIRVICAPRAGPGKAVACNWAARCAGDQGVPQVADGGHSGQIPVSKSTRIRH